MIDQFILDNLWFVYVCIGLLSLCVGSLLNVITYRLPLMLQKEWKQQCCELLAIENKDDTPPINLFFPRSFCPKCKTQVKSWQNIPILSYLFLKGACHQCKNPISLRYPLTELCTLLISLYATWHFGFTPKLFFALAALWLLIPMILIDLEHQLLPDSLTLSLLWLGLIANTQNLFTDLPNAVLSAAGAYVFLWVFIQLFYLITGKIGMGNGDFKLFAAFGAWFGWTALPFILLISSLSGAIIGVCYLKLNKKSKDTTIPYGPFLCVAGITYMFWGEALIHWYLHKLF